MTSFATFVTQSGFDREFCVRLTTALVHFTWEGLLLLGISATIAIVLRRQSANLRYALQLATLIALVGCLPVTYALLEGKQESSLLPPRMVAETTADDVPPSDGSERLIAAAIPESPSLPGTSISRFPSREATLPGESGSLAARVDGVQTFFNDRAPEREPLPLLSRVAPFAVATYLFGVLVMALRLLAALCGGHRLRAAAIPAIEPPFPELVRREAQRLGLKVVPAVAWCWQISTPIVVGVLRPTILLPASIVVGLSPEDFAGILLHELAHIRRFDLAVNLFQRLIETLLFFHPAVWFVSRQITRERENCCDDCVLNAGWRRTAYAELLVRVAEVCAVSMPPVASATGAGIFGEGPSELKRRVLRLLATEPRTRICLSRSGALLMSALLIAAVGGAALREGREPDSNAGSQSRKDPSEKRESDRNGISIAERSARELDGMVFAPDGKPAAGAQVAIANWSVEVQFQNGKLAYVGSAAERQLTMVETDAAGRFHLPKEVDPQAIVVAHVNGYAEVEDPRRVLPSSDAGPKDRAESTKKAAPARLDAGMKIELQPYGRLIGTLPQGSQPAAGTRFQIGSSSSLPCRHAPSRISLVVDSDRNGRFVVTRMPPGPAWCQRCAVVGEATMPLDGLLVHFDVAAGKVTNLALGSPGPMVVGKLALPQELDGRIVWPEVELQLAPRGSQQIALVGGFGGGGPPNNDDPWKAFLQSDEGRAYVRRGITIAADGAFRIEGLLPADYTATITVPATALKEPIAGAFKATHFPVRVSPAGQIAAGVKINLGTIPLVYEVNEGDARRSTPVDDQPRKSAMPDEKAQAIAVRAHRALRAIDTLPRFYLRIAQGNGTVDTQRDEAAVTLDGLKRAIDGPVNQPDGYFDSRMTLAWSGKTAFTGNGAADVLSTTPASGAYRFWTPDEAWSRHQQEGQPPEFIFVPEGKQLADSITYDGIFRMTPHRFWWGLPSARHAQIEPVPTELAAYRTVGEEVFDSELCDVVESVRRAERLWVSRKTGLLRGAAQYHRTGVFTKARAEAHTVLSNVYEHFDEVASSADPGKEQPSREALQTALATLDDYPGPFEPNELICFRDFRQIAPDVWFPFREDRAFTHGSSSGPDRRKFIRLWWSAEEVRTDVDLTKAIQDLGPKAGDRVSQDQRFGLPLKYDYRAGRTPRELLELIQTEQHAPHMQGFQSHLTMRINAMVGRPSPPLPAERWIGGDPPRIDGVPHLLHFWADWSQPSFKDLPELRKLAADGATILGIHPAGTPSKKIADVMERHQLGYPTVLAPENGNESFNQNIAGYPVWDYPYCVLVDREGRIAAHGRLTSELLDQFRKLRNRARE